MIMPIGKLGVAALAPRRKFGVAGSDCRPRRH